MPCVTIHIFSTISIICSIDFECNLFGPFDVKFFYLHNNIINTSTIKCVCVCVTIDVCYPVLYSLNPLIETKFYLLFIQSFTFEYCTQYFEIKGTNPQNIGHQQCSIWFSFVTSIRIETRNQIIHRISLIIIERV